MTDDVIKDAASTGTGGSPDGGHGGGSNDGASRDEDPAPRTETSGPRGVDLGDTGGTSVVTVVAAEETRQAAFRIAAAVQRAGPAGVLLVDDRSTAVSDVVHLQVSSALDGLERLLAQFEDRFPAEAAPPDRRRAVPVAAAASVAIGLGTRVTDFIGMFRADYRVSARQVSINRLALLADVAGELTRLQVPVVMPGFALVTESAIFARLAGLVDRRYVLQQRSTVVQFRDVDPKMTQLELAQARLTEVRTRRDDLLASGKTDEAGRLDALVDEARAEVAALFGDAELHARRADVASLAAFLAAFDAAVTSLVTTPAGATSPPLVAAALREQLRTADPPISHLLFVDVTASGGDAISKTWLWGWNAQAAFLGAVQASYLLVAVDGRLAAGGTETGFGAARFDFKRSFSSDVVGWDTVNKLLHPVPAEPAPDWGAAGGTDDKTR